MISGFQITASLQPPTVSFHRSDSTQQLELDSAKHHLQTVSYDELIRALSARVEKLETEVFKQTDSSQVPAIKDTEPDPHEPTHGASRSVESSQTKWASIFEEVGRRLDFCAAQPSVSECISSMKDLKRELNILSETFGNRLMSREHFTVCEPFLKPSPGPAIAKYPRKEEPVWRLQAPQHRHQFIPRASFGKASGESGKKWGPCFYCTCPEWKPGHSCEGSRAAEQKRKEKESRASQ